ncbi:MAG: hypothetical protein QW594_02815 [Candidatus Woesearchaeota archaeon]
MLCFFLYVQLASRKRLEFLLLIAIGGPAPSGDQEKCKNIARIARRKERVLALASTMLAAHSFFPLTLPTLISLFFLFFFSLILLLFPQFYP